MYAESRKNKNLVFFDFDGTLCKKDSFTGFIFYALSKRHIVRQGIKILPWIQAYYLKIYPADAMRSKLFQSMFAEQDVNDILNVATEYSKTLIHHFNPMLYEQFLKHQARGDEIVIVSASIDLYLAPIAELLHVQLICTETKIVHHQLTGEYSTPDCSSLQKKVRILEKYNLEDYASIYAYGNSDEDREMLSLADHTYMVGESSELPFIEEEKKLA